ncbi:hypothetical protein SAMN05216359_101363 [Roseateles sp. YR242]|nr:hypothetical protein SAMN05216359_101363 [Roseateles sp. YR242]
MLQQAPWREARRLQPRDASHKPPAVVVVCASPTRVKSHLSLRERYNGAFRQAYTIASNTT